MVVFNVIRVHIVYVTIKVGVANILERHDHAPYHCVPTKHFQELLQWAGADLGYFESGGSPQTTYSSCSGSPDLISQACTQSLFMI